jgi:hypothetical protein
VDVAREARKRIVKAGVTVSGKISERAIEQLRFARTAFLDDAELEAERDNAAAPLDSDIAALRGMPRAIDEIDTAEMEF